MSADMALGTDGVLRSKIIEMKRSGIEMTGFPKCLIFRTLYEVLNVQKITYNSIAILTVMIYSN